MSLTPYFAFAKKSFLQKSAYRLNHWMGILNTLIRLFIYIEIYRALYGGRESVDGITLSMVTTNFILALGLESFFIVDDFYLSNRINNGSIATELLLPVTFYGRMLASNLGVALFELIFHFLPAMIFAVLFFGIQAPLGFGNMILFLLSALFGYGVLWSLSFLFQMFSFWLLNVWAIMTIKNVFINVLSGSMIPLWFMPDFMKKIISFTPFDSIYFTPVQIYLGNVTSGQIAAGFLKQIIWIICLMSAGFILWNKGKRKLVVQGG
ncbi:MAG: ABC-2 family transporter protein [Treponema sp.]|nr:ABC-2 family transporter protein [Treponema sp.]